jgi:anti-sigma factor ChrR (cupin superfamily)
MAPEVQRDDASVPRKSIQDSTHRGLPDVVREAVADHESEIGNALYSGYVHSVQKHAVM